MVPLSIAAVISFEKTPPDVREMLGKRISQLGLRIEGTQVERFVHQLYRELDRKGLELFRPVCYLTDEWGCPDGQPVIGIPFYLADPKLARLEREPRLWSPGALLRPLVQDALLPTAAYVAGPAEIAYHAQIAPAYAHFGVPRPSLLPRPSLTLVEAQQARGCAVTVLVTRPWTPRVFGLLHSDWIRPPLQVSQFDTKLQIAVCHYPSVPRDLWPELNGLLYRISCRAFLRGLVRANKPDVIHAHTEPTGNLAVAVGREFNVPVVVTLHGINTSPRQLSTEARRASLRAPRQRSTR